MYFNSTRKDRKLTRLARKQRHVANILNKVAPARQVAETCTGRLLDYEGVSKRRCQVYQQNDPQQGAGRTTHVSKSDSILDTVTTGDTSGVAIFEVTHLLAMQFPRCTHSLSQAPKGAYQHR